MPQSVSVRGGGVVVDARDFKRLARELRRAAPQTSRELRRRLKAVGEVVAADAREIAREHSQSIPPTIRTRLRGIGVYVEAGGPRQQAAIAREMFASGYGTTEADRHQKELTKRAQGVAIAGLFELGNHGNIKSASAASSGRFRHPVYGNRDRWVNQDMHPFLAPAVKKNEALIQREVTAALNDALRVLGGLE